MWALKKWCVTKVAHCIHLRLRDGSNGQKNPEDHVAYQIKGKGHYSSLTLCTPLTFWAG